jgi:hypothetical protein
MSEYYDRYKEFRRDGKILKMPLIKIPVESTDLYVTFDKSRMRIDSLSYKYYGDANYGWLLMLANPHLGSMEFEIPDKSMFRIPYPLNTAIIRYESGVRKYFGQD